MVPRTACRGRSASPTGDQLPSRTHRQPAIGREMRHSGSGVTRHPPPRHDPGAGSGGKARVQARLPATCGIKGRSLTMKSQAISSAPTANTHVARQAHPLPEQRRVVEGDAARIGEPVLVHRVELRPADREEVEQDPQHQPAIVEPERPEPELLAERRRDRPRRSAGRNRSGRSPSSPKAPNSAVWAWFRVRKVPCS